MRIPSYEKYKIGDQFRVPSDVFDPNEDVLARVLAGLPPKTPFKHYIRLPDGDKLIRETND